MLLLGVAIWAFVWAVDDSPLEDLDDEGARVLFPDEAPDHPGTHPSRPSE